MGALEVQMCDVCLETPCMKICPNYEDEVVGFCAQCGNELFENEDYLYNDEYCFCDKDCVLDFFDIKENLW